MITIGIHIDFKFCGFLTKHRNPGIEIVDVQEFQFAILQILLHHENVSNRVGNGGAGGHNHSAAIVLPLDAVNLVHHGIALGRAGITETSDTSNVGIQADILIVVCFVYKERVDAQIVKSHVADIVRHIILHLVQNTHNCLPLHVDGSLVGKITDRFIQPLQLFFVKLLIILLGKRQHIKATVCH